MKSVRERRLEERARGVKVFKNRTGSVNFFKASSLTPPPTA